MSRKPFRTGAARASTPSESRITVLKRSPTRLDLPDGGCAELNGEALEVRDREGRLLVRYVDGTAEISAPTGDLRLRAPAGRVVVESGLDVHIEAGRDVVQRAGRRLDLSAARGDGCPQVRIEHGSTDIASDRVNVRATRSEAIIGDLTIAARTVATTADRVVVTAVHYEVMAERLVERSKDAFREVFDLAESRFGRLRSLVKDVYSLSSRRTVMTSTEDTNIDGKRVLLG